MERMHYFYVLKSLKDLDLYWGFTGDLQRRFREHQTGQVIATRFRRPLKLVYYEAYASKEDAYHREQAIKKNGKAWAQLKRRISKSIQET